MFVPSWKKNRLRFDVLDPGHVEEVVLVVIGDEPLHLCGIHASVRLRDVNHRRAQVREDIDLHALHSEQ
jgi:hypothetical protein